MANRFEFRLDSDGKVRDVADTLTGRMVMQAGKLLSPAPASAGLEEVRFDSAEWVMPAGKGGTMRQDSASTMPATKPAAGPQRVTSAADGKRAMMGRVDPRWTPAPAPSRSTALMRFDAADKSKARPAGVIGSAAEAREIMQRRRNV